MKRTNFAEYDEEVMELPSIFTYVWTRTNLKFNTDFNISYRLLGSVNYVNLTGGENLVGDGPLRVDFQQREEENIFKITPINFKHGMGLDYTLTFTFEKSLDLELISHIGVELRTENNSYLHCDEKYYDGDVDDQRCKLGEKGYIIVTPEKYTVK